MQKGKSPLTPLILEFLEYSHQSAECGFYMESMQMDESEIIRFIDHWLDMKWEQENSQQNQRKNG